MTAAHYTQHWDDKFRLQEWGRYPPEDLVRFMGRNYKHAQKSSVRVLEVGCGPGANLWFLHREGFAVSGIDVSPSAIDIATKRMATENSGCLAPTPDLRVGNFGALPWADATFDVVIDIFAVYANTTDIIAGTVREIARVLKPGGRFYAKLWGTNTTGYGKGIRLEDGTYDAIPEGPCHNMGVSHFFDRAGIEDIYSPYFDIVAIDSVQRSDAAASQQIEEFHCQFIRKT